jgi:hypothetical protein
MWRGFLRMQRGKQTGTAAAQNQNICVMTFR